MDISFLPDFIQGFLNSWYESFIAKDAVDRTDIIMDLFLLALSGVLAVYGLVMTRLQNAVKKHEKNLLQQIEKLSSDYIDACAAVDVLKAEILRINTFYPAHVLDSAKSEFEEGHHEQAIAKIRIAIENVAPDLSKCYVILGERFIPQIYTHKGAATIASRCFQSAILLDSRNETARTYQNELNGIGLPELNDDPASYESLQKIYETEDFLSFSSRDEARLYLVDMNQRIEALANLRSLIVRPMAYYTAAIADTNLSAQEPLYFDTKAACAEALSFLGNIEESSAIVEKELPRAIQVFGEDGLETVKLRKAKAQNHVGQKNTDAAIVEMDRVIDIVKEFPEIKTYLFTCIMAKASILKEAQKYAESLETLEKGILLYRQHAGEKTRTWVAIQTMKSDILLESGDHSRAQEAIDSTLDLIDREFPEETWYQFLLRYMKARILYDLEDMQGALALTEIMRSYVTGFDQGFVEKIHFLRLHQNALYQNKLYERCVVEGFTAIQAIDKVQETGSTFIGMDTYAEIVMRQIMGLHKLNDHDGVNTMYAFLSNRLAPALPADDKAVLQSKHYYVHSLVAQGKTREAEAILEEIIPMHRSVFGPENPNTQCIESVFEAMRK